MQKGRVKKHIAACFLLIPLLFSAGCGEEQAEELSNYEQGMLALREGNYRGAMAAFQEAVRIDKMAAKGYRGQGIVYFREGNYNNAITMFTRSQAILEGEPNNRDLLRDVMLYKVEAYKENGQIDLARDLCDDLLSAGGNDAKTLILRGELSAAENDMERAGEDFRDALERDPSYENYLRVYATYDKKNRRADGAELLFEALRTEPRSGEDEYDVGRIYYVLGEIDAAKEHLDKAGAEGVRRAGILLARISLDTGDVSGARSIYRGYLEREEELSTAYNGLVLCDIADVSYNSALENVRAGLSCGDNTAREALLFNEVIIYERMLDFDTARQKLTDFLQLYPNNEEARRENLFLQNR